MQRSRGGADRTILGIAGAPGAGKSTLAESLVAHANSLGWTAMALPMDGFHLAQAMLDHRGLGDVKGAPETFDAHGYVALLRRIRQPGHDPVWAPTFDRSLEDPIAGAIEVAPDTKLVVTEGNYLLLDEPPWDQVAPLLDAAWFVEAPSEEVRRQRLIERRISFGEDPDRARTRVLASDERNAEIVARGHYC